MPTAAETTEKLRDHLGTAVDLYGIAASGDFVGCEPDMHPEEVFPGTRSVVVLAMKHLDSLSLSRDKNCQALSQDLTKHELLHAVYSTSRLLEDAGFTALPLAGSWRIWPDTDHRESAGRISLRHAGELAGIGRISRIGILMNHLYGPRIQLAAVLTDAVLESNRKAVPDPCIGCDLCIRNCPAGAITAPPEGEAYLPVDGKRCLDFRYREGGESPLGYRRQCAVCRSVCPVGRPEKRPAGT